MGTTGNHSESLAIQLGFSHSLVFQCESQFRVQKWSRVDQGLPIIQTNHVNQYDWRYILSHFEVITRENLFWEAERRKLCSLFPSSGEVESRVQSRSASLFTFLFTFLSNSLDFSSLSEHQMWTNVNEVNKTIIISVFILLSVGMRKVVRKRIHI